MASGSNITATGMQTMQQVVAGTDLVEPADFNNALTNLNRLLGAPQNVTLGSPTIGTIYGYGQGGAGTTAAVTGSLIRVTGAGGFRDIQDDVQALCAYLGVTVRAGVGTDVGTNTTITAQTWNNLMLNIRDCWNDRFSPASRTISTQTTATSGAAWNTDATQTTTWTFTSAEQCRQFFNMGGGLGTSASRSGGVTNNKNTSWTNKLSAFGDLIIYANGTSDGAGTRASFGFYQLTTNFQQMAQYFGGTSPYADDRIVVNARVNSTTAPTQVIIQTRLFDDGYSGEVIDELVEGTLTINARRHQPNANGSGFTIPAPSVSAGAISFTTPNNTPFNPPAPTQPPGPPEPPPPAPPNGFQPD